MNEVLETFNQEFLKLNEKEVEKFREIVNKLINVNYLTSYKEEDKNTYYLIYNHFDCFQSYFYLGGRELTHYQTQKTFVLTSPYTLKLSLNKVTSIIILIIRLLYNQKMLDFSLDNQVHVTMLELQDKYEKIVVSNERLNDKEFTERLSNKELAESLKLLKRHNIIDFKGNEYQKDDFTIIIYPTIQYAVGMNEIKDIILKIDSYKGKEEENEETEEN